VIRTQPTSTDCAAVTVAFMPSHEPSTGLGTGVTAGLDASAALALIYREPGHDHVASILSDAVISTVSWAEIVAKLANAATRTPLRRSPGCDRSGERPAVCSGNAQLARLGRSGSRCVLRRTTGRFGSLHRPGKD
jgi:hypothetical protein